MKLATYSRGIKSIDILEEALGQTVVLAGNRAGNNPSIIGFVGWGRKRSGERASQVAALSSKSVIFLEDGLLGFWGHPSGDCIRLSLNIDRQGIYYDARHPSQLEAMLNDEAKLDQSQVRRVQSLITSIKENHLSKYNHLSINDMPDVLQQKIDAAKSVCLVVDQTLGDKSISCGLAGDVDFTRMLNAAVEENPDALIVVKTHPDVVSGIKKSAIGAVKSSSSLLWVADDIHPHALISAATKVYVVTSQLGFEALLFAKKVVCFGVPFYAGWGLTDDRGEVPDRRETKVSIEKLVFDSLIRYPVYVHPDTKKRTSPEAIIDWLKYQSRGVTKKYDTLLAVDFSFWKRRWLSAFTTDLVTELKFVTTSQLMKADKHSSLLVWGARKAENLRAKYPDRELFTMEDGFVRSAGLGVDLNRPSSLVLDRRGIYYDSRQPSDLEVHLNKARITDEQFEQALAIIDKLITSKTTNYNIGDGIDSSLSEWIEDQKAQGKQIILVPGQVEGDASIAFGSPRWKTNLGLMQQVKQDFTDAVILYKPHPDIVANGRKNKSNIMEEKLIADRTVSDINIALLYDKVDRVCVLTSLSGFEALIRGVAVSVYGLPFYAGWGLTDDRLNIPRRTAKLSVESLVYTSLVTYPRYVNWETGRFCSLMNVIEQIGEAPVRKTGSSFISRLRKKVGFLRAS